MNSYAKLRDGSWGVRVEGTTKPDQELTIQKKDGSTRQETIARVLWSGRDQQTGRIVSLCSVVPREQGRAEPAPRAEERTQVRRQGGARRAWQPCGYPGCHPQFCDECDGEGYVPARRAG